MSLEPWSWGVGVGEATPSVTEGQALGREQFRTFREPCTAAGQPPSSRASAPLPPAAATKQSALVRCFHDHISPLLGAGRGRGGVSEELDSRAGKALEQASGAAGTYYRGLFTCAQLPTALHSPSLPKVQAQLFVDKFPEVGKMPVNDICSHWGKIRDIHRCHFQIQCGKGFCTLG